MKGDMFAKYRKVIVWAIGLALVFNLGFYFGNESSAESRAQGVANTSLGIPQGVTDFSSFWKVWNIIDEKFVPTNDEVVADSQERMYGAIQGLAASLGDPYTTFFPPVESEMFESTIRGNFGGVGMEVGMRDGVLTVIAPLKDTPAEKAGVRSGDIIIAIDDELTQGSSVDESVQKIRGEIGTKVILTMMREGVEESFDVEIVRDTINIPTLDTELRPDGIFVISLYNFSAQSANLFRDALDEFIDSGSKKLILDLRGNPGGFLEASVDIASWFLPAGKVIVMEDFGGNDENKQYRSKGYDVFDETLDFVILIDGGSASASEILAGALREHGKARLVGETTFGKGSVQELIDITPDTSFKVTVARWLTPKGNSISKGGVTPDIEVPYSLEDFEEGRDPQMEKAVEVLLEE